MPSISSPKKPKHSSSHRALLEGEVPISKSKIGTMVRTQEAACPSLALGLVVWITFMSPKEGAEARDKLAPFPS